MSDDDQPERPDMRELREIQVDRENLYREEVFTDLRVATIRRLTPILADGTQDASRPVLFSGETQLMTGAGMIPVHAPIEAATLEEALNRFPEAVQTAVERLMEEAREMQRREMSRIVVPGQGGGMAGGGLPPPPGGKIDLG